MLSHGAAKKTRGTVVDIDIHVHEDPVELASFAEMPWKRALLALGEFPEHNLDLPGLSPSTLEDGTDPTYLHSRSLIHPKEPLDLRRELNTRGIDIGIIFPDHLLKMALFANADQALSLARAYNRWLAKHWLGRTDGTYGALCIAPQDPHGSAEEISSMGKNERIACVLLPTGGLQQLYGHKRYDPIYEAAEKIGKPVVLHNIQVLHSVFPFQLEQYPNKLGRYALSDPLSMSANLVHILSAGVISRFPRLKVCFASGGISWIPWVMARLDEEYLRNPDEVPFLERAPSSYIREFGYATQPILEVNPGDYSRLLGLLGTAEHIMYSSDWPHDGFNDPGNLDGTSLPTEVKRKILGDNAIRFFSLS